MEPTVEEKKKLFQKDHIRYHDLIKTFQQYLRLWFTNGTVDNSLFKKLFNSCVDIIVNGLRNADEKLNTEGLLYDSSLNNNTKNYESRQQLNELHKIIDEFEWVRNALAIRQNSIGTPSSAIRLATPSVQAQNVLPSVTTHARAWLEYNLNEHNLCGFLQYLINDKELLEEYYDKEALLSQESYFAILVICLTAFDARQSDLLNRIYEDVEETKQRKKCRSEPNIFLDHPDKSIILTKSTFVTSHIPDYFHVSCTKVRKSRSASELINKQINMDDNKFRVDLPQNRPHTMSQCINCDSIGSNATTLSSVSFIFDGYDNKPTTSQASSHRSKSQLSNYTLDSNKSATSSLTSNSMSSFSSSNSAKSVQIINTDDIKIWTDYSWEQTQKSKQQQHLPPTTTCDIPPSLTPITKTSQSLSPCNSFFSYLFNTPPIYSSWLTGYDGQTEQEPTETAIESIMTNNSSFHNHKLPSQQRSSSLSLGSTVFDKFLAVDGKKVRSRKSHNIFDDVSTALDSSGIHKLVSVGNIITEKTTPIIAPSFTSETSKNCQSLTRFLKMSYLSRNNTDLEKENAHFHVSEAIISAIEHIKWSKLEMRSVNCNREATPIATDYLAPPDSFKSTTVVTTPNGITEEHVPYAELEEISYDVLSAEVVGLSLISKFDEKHLPKVSELKWLVSDDDTPQKLLAMPDLSSASNTDDHTIHSATRGTRYWAPPRQQIIFTDHSTVNRKELLKKQNFRCAGCGMRVSLQYVQRFRYCNYLGKYHCTGCHRNQISAIPAKILQTWDFKCYPVSVFAYRLLEQMYAYPLFYIPNLNPALYISCKSLVTARYKRLQLKYVKDFICMCRFALREQSYFRPVPDYITSDIDNWSMSDFIDTHNNCLQRSIDELIKKCERHIFHCVLCTARGFLCEYCHNNAVIYPWGSRVERCDGCGTCFHRSCWKSLRAKCCRCRRIGKRHDENNGLI